MQTPHSIIAAHAPEFLERTAGLSYIRRGVFWSELLAFSALAKHAGAKRVVESGTGLGFSATVLSRLFEHVTTIGKEAVPPGLPNNVFAVTGDAWEEMWRNVGHGDALLIDGPKGSEAVLLAQEQCSSPVDCPGLIAVHDCQRGSVARRLLDKAFPGMWYTDDADYVAAFGHLDRECLDMAASRGKTFAVHGPTLGILVL